MSELHLKLDKEYDSLSLNQQRELDMLKAKHVKEFDRRVCEFIFNYYILCCNDTICMMQVIIGYCNNYIYSYIKIYYLLNLSNIINSILSCQPIQLAIIII